MTILTKTIDKNPEKKLLPVPELVLPSAPVSIENNQKTYTGKKDSSITKAYIEIH